MVLAYFAIASLLLITAYSAMVSFRQRPDDGTGGWIFPNGAPRAFRAVVGVCTLILLAGFAVWFLTSARNAERRSSRFLIPEGYVGWVRIEFDVAGTPPVPVESGENVLKVPAAGILRTTSSEQYGWANDRYYYYSESSSRKLPDKGAASLIWGKINGEESGSAGKRTYEEFFVGTEQQFKQQIQERLAPTTGGPGK